MSSPTAKRFPYFELAHDEICLFFIYLFIYFFKSNQQLETNVSYTLAQKIPGQVKSANPRSRTFQRFRHSLLVFAYKDTQWFLLFDNTQSVRVRNGCARFVHDLFKCLKEMFLKKTCRPLVTTLYNYDVDWVMNACRTRTNSVVHMNVLSCLLLTLHE